MLELNTVSGELVWHGMPLARLSRSETLLLGHFIEHAEELLSQDSLLDAGWPQSIVAPNTLVVAIKNIRKHLSQTGASIETVHRRGYIFHPGAEPARILSIEVASSPVSADTNIEGNANKNAESHTTSCVPQPTVRDNTSYNGTTKVQTAHESETVATEARENKLGENIIAAPIGKKAISLTKWPSIRLLFSRISFYILLLFSIVTAIFVYESTQEWHCYQVQDASICGIFSLDAAQQQIIMDKLNGRSGTFLYGYEKDFSKLNIYQVH